MAGSQLPQPLLLLTLVLLLKPDWSSGATTVTAIGVTISEMESLTSESLTSPSSHPSPSSVENHNSQETDSTPNPSTPSSESGSITPSNSGGTSTMQPTSSQAETVTHSSSGSPSSEHTLTSHSSPLSSISLTTLHRSPTHLNPSTVPSSVSSATTDGTSVASDLGAREPKVILCPSHTGVILKRLGWGVWMGLGCLERGKACGNKAPAVPLRECGPEDQRGSSICLGQQNMVGNFPGASRDLPKAIFNLLKTYLMGSGCEAHVPDPKLSVWESADSGLAPMNALGGGVVRRCFSGTPLLPPLSSRLGTTGDVEPSACVVFNIEAGGNEQSHSLASGR
ncbi:uncharacterized homolog [Kogia breviceps]|uniref:uncharacterized homolog n=1 Tax=Kogia breviceps TaxID=27615 RepID=UPI0034D30E16